MVATAEAEGNLKQCQGLVDHNTWPRCLFKPYVTLKIVRHLEALHGCFRKCSAQTINHQPSTIGFRGKANAGCNVVNVHANLSDPPQVIYFRNSAPSLIFILSVSIHASNCSEMLLSHLQFESFLTKPASNCVVD